MTQRFCAIIPSHNHHLAIEAVIADMHDLGLEVWVIDDASDQPTADALAALHAPLAGVTVIRRAINGGKGAAVADGLRRVAAAGFTHAVQIDADGQHDRAVLPQMLGFSRQHPDAMVIGQAMFDRSAPLGRRIGRWVTHLWVFIETLSLRLRDTMCGCRVYPLVTTVAVLDRAKIGTRMDFDSEILVRLFWRGVPPVMVPVQVTYPPNNTSNFNIWRDNWLLTRMHTRLVLIMLWRLPRILTTRPRPITRLSVRSHWATLDERGRYLGLRIGVLLWRLLGRRGCLIVLSPVVAYFWLTGSQSRRASLQFLARAFAARGDGRHPSWGASLGHFMHYAARILDGFIARIGGADARMIISDDPAGLAKFAADPRGGIIIVAHLGNAELSRALLDARSQARLVVLVHTRHAMHYERLLREYGADAHVTLIEVTDIGPETAIALRARVDAGDWIVIAGDRTPVTGTTRVSRVPFLGHDAPLSHGPYILASLMECPVWLLFCRRVGGRHVLSIAPFADKVVLPRRTRLATLADYATTYAVALETEVLKDPFQWYNFYDFWA